MKTGRTRAWQVIVTLGVLALALSATAPAIAQSHEARLTLTAEDRLEVQELINRYPEGTGAQRAQERITQLQELFAIKAYKAALYYFRLKAYDSAILYLKDLVATYPKTAIAPQALVKLVQAYKTLGYREDVQETCGYIRRFHPGAPGSSAVCPPDTTGTS